MSGGTNVTTSETGPWEHQREPLKYGFEQAKDIYKSGPPKYYGGATVAGFDPAQQAAQAGKLGYAMGPRATGMQRDVENLLFGVSDIAKQAPEYAIGRGNVAQGYADDALRNIKPTTDAMMSGRVNTGPGSPYGDMMNVFGKQAMSQLTGKVLPGIRQSLVQYQPGGSTRGDLVQTKAISAANQQMLDKAAQMYGDAYGQAQAQRLPAAQQALGAYGQASQAAGTAGQLGLQGYGTAGNLAQTAFGSYPSIMQAPLSMYDTMGGVGAERRAMTQEALNQDMARHQYASTADQQNLANYMNMIQGNYGGTTTQTTPGESQLGNIAQIAGIAAAFMSDIRAKENIKPDGTWKGFNVYTYNYKESFADPIPRRRGVMAQEVELTRPDAVVEIDGIKHVNYGAL